MVNLENLVAGAQVRGITADGSSVCLEKIEFYGSNSANVLYRDLDGRLQERLLYRGDESNLTIEESALPWSFDADGDLLRLASEAYRIKLAHLFDPFIAVETSLIRPLPHQITAVYESMLPRQPLRFLLADDPGAGKTIMTGLLLKELILRGDLERCLIVPPGSLVEQWQDELDQKFGLHFNILSKESFETSRSGNPFDENPFCIARLDQLSRNEDYQAKLLNAPEWDLVVIDEAHKMSATYFGNDLKRTKRFDLGRVLGGHARNLLLLTATPHNGKEEDFQLFLSLLDSDRFEGKHRDGVHTCEPSDLMRRLVKEELLTFEGKPLFPERRAYTVSYDLSDPEAALYHDVTEYVREEMNRAERFAEEDGQRKVNVGFALTILQRRLASSPRAIHRSLERRLSKLQDRVTEEKILARGGAISDDKNLPQVGKDWEELYDQTDDEITEIEDAVVGGSTAAATIQELETEILTLKRLEAQARRVTNMDSDAKWVQLREILENEYMHDTQGNRRKLLIFTEARDTLEYLQEKITSYIGKAEEVAAIHGGVKREARRNIIQAFNQDKDLKILVANDAAGEGVNLQRAHLMVNYDLPWNPNRLEQRFGRIHRIGQTEVCHCWNLVAHETREGAVFERLLEKLETERKALGGRVYDVLGKLFTEKPLKQLLIEAVRYGDDPTVKAKLDTVVDNAVNHQQLLECFDERALVRNVMDATAVSKIREQMEIARMRRLHPHFVQSFFLEAFRRLGGKIKPANNGNEPNRFEITHVPADVREYDRLIGQGAAVLKKYERITFHKDCIEQAPAAEFVYPGHPLMDSVSAIVLEKWMPLMRQGALLVDDQDESENIRFLFYLENSVQDGRTTKDGDFRVISHRMQFIDVGEDGHLQDAGNAPYLDYRSITDEERGLVADSLEQDWIMSDWEKRVKAFAIQEVVPKHVEEVKTERLHMLEKTEREVVARLTKEINHWDARAEDLRLKELAGKKTKLSAHNAQSRANDLVERMDRRKKEIALQRAIAGQSPRVKGGVLVIPGGLLKKLGGESTVTIVDAAARKAVEMAAMRAVEDAERTLGREPEDVSLQKGLGYDIQSKDPMTGDLFFIEVKGRAAGKNEVTLTRSELMASRNHPEKWRLAMVIVDGDRITGPRYLSEHSFAEPDFGETSRSFKLNQLIDRAEAPC